MDNSKEIAAENPTNPKEAFKGGLLNWILILFIFVCIHLAIDNYASYGIIRSPYDITLDYIRFLQNKPWVFVIIYLGYLLQSFQCYIIEVAIAKEWIAEKIGLCLHAFNTLFLLNLTSAVFFIDNIHGVTAFKLLGMPFFTSFKFWSFAWENKLLRDNRKSANLKDDKSMDNESNKGHVIVYPENVTLKNVYIFTVCTTSMLYNPEGVRKTKRDVRKLIRMILEAIVIHYMLVFIIYQYIFPEYEVMFARIKQGFYLQATSSAFKVMIPVHILWLLHHFLYLMHYMLHFPSVLWGTDQNLVTYKDWWNSENNFVFWGKWNFQLHLWFKKYVYVPLLQMGYGKQFSAYATNFVSGILHEYLQTVPFRTALGVPTFVLLAQIPMGNLTVSIQRKWGDRVGNFVVLVVLFFEPFINITTTYALYFYFKD